MALKSRLEMRRIFLFLATNMAVLLVLGVVMNLLEPWLIRQGIDLNHAFIRALSQGAA